MNSMDQNPYTQWSFLFGLRFMLGNFQCRVWVREDGTATNGGTKYLASVRYAGKWIFSDNNDSFELCGSFSPMHAIDGPEAREHILSHLAMKPGDTDSEFFEDYTDEQLSFVEEFSDEIYMTKLDRYREG